LPTQLPEGWGIAESAHNMVLSVFELFPKNYYVSLAEMFKSSEIKLTELCKYILDLHTSVKIQLCKQVLLKNLNRESPSEKVFLNSFAHRLLNDSFIDDVMFSCQSQIVHQLNVYSELGSSWALESIEKVQVKVSKYQPIQVMGGIRLPEYLKKRQTLVNIDSASQDCFKFCVLAYFYIKKYGNIRKLKFAEYLYTYIIKFDMLGKTEMREKLNFACLPKSGGVCLQM